MLAAGNPALQFLVGHGQFRRPPPQRDIQAVQLELVPHHGAMRLHDGGEGLGKKQLRPFDQPIAVSDQRQRAERLFVNARQFQRFHPQRGRLPSQPQCRLQARLPRTRPRLQIAPQGGHIVL